MKNSVLCAFVLVGAYVGVGFVSGKELAYNFARFGVVGIVMAGIIAVLLTLVVYVDLKLCLMAHCNQHKRFLQIKDTAGVVCGFAVMSTMIAGVFSTEISSGNAVFALALLAFGFVCVYFGLKTAGVFDAVFVFLLAISIVIFAMNSKCDVGEMGRGAWFVLPVLYLGMNLITLSGVVSIISKRLKTPRNCKICSLVFGLFVGVVLVLSVMIEVLNSEIIDFNMPLLKLAGDISSVFGEIYKYILVCGLLSTLIATGIVAKNAISRFIKSKLIATMVVFAVGMIVSLVGFTKAIVVVYPIMGCLGLVVYAIEMMLLIKMRKLKNAN